MAKYNIKNYLRYMRDNPKGYWFKRKLYGWGWVPVKWEGWLVTLGFVAIILLSVLFLSPRGDPTAADPTFFFGVIIISIIVLIGICHKTGEKPRWAWGR